MKATTIIATLLFGTALAAPGAISLKRSFVETDNTTVTANMKQPCVECPCNGFFGGCYCVRNGCCGKNCAWPRA